MYHVWKIPERVVGRTVLRLRYNITTKDFDLGSAARPEDKENPGFDTSGSNVDQFFIDSSFDPVVQNDPNKDYLELGPGHELQIQLNTNQLARTFQDRTHTFIVKERPPEVSSTARIVNYNVRGRRGNIVQTYPSVEYDFVPEDLTIESGTYLHFQWTGSDANPNGNAGNGRQGTDRSNLVQVGVRGENVPVPISKHTLFFNSANDPSNSEGRALVERFAYLDQQKVLQNVEETCDPDENNNNALTNCKQLNGASAYFDGGLVEMTQVGVHHIASTRNNDFSNRSHKTTIRITRNLGEWYFILAAAVGAAMALTIFCYLFVACYALNHPHSYLFSARYRPRVLRCLVSKERLHKALAERRSNFQARHEQQNAVKEQKPGQNPDLEKASLEAPIETKSSCIGMCSKRSKGLGFGEHSQVVIAYGGMNIIAFAIGALTNLSGGFLGSYAYPFAKGAGFSLDLNFAILVLPTLKTLQTAMRHMSATREWMPIDDPIHFHTVVAMFILLGSIVHIGFHVVHILAIAYAPPLQRDPLELWALSLDEQISGMRWWEQLLNYRVQFAPLTGILLIIIMAAMYLTALPCARRGTNCCTRRLGGFNLFWRVHASWKLVYLLLLLHAPQKLWIWFFFPAILVAIDRMMLANGKRMYLTLKRVKLMPCDVIGLTFGVPYGFTYQAGQYILLGWRGEWHPFTLTSAPEEHVLSVHIRAIDNLDWCSALRRRLVDEAPAASVALAEGGSGSSAPKAKREKAKPGTVIEYTEFDHPLHEMVYCRPSGGNGVSEKLNSRKLGKSETQYTLDSRTIEQNLPKDAVVLQVAGPFGAPAQKVWQYEVVMVVGAGIGVTPFASILRSVQLRTQQRQALLRTGAKLSTALPQWWGSLAGNTSKDGSSSIPSTEDVTNKLLEDVITVPRKVYFYWIVRNQAEFDWFYDLLATAAEGPAKDIISICVFITGEIELTQVKKLPCSQGQYFGRPQWGRVFKQMSAEHKGKHIGVFLCGSPAIGAELAKQSEKNTEWPHGTRFSFFPEHF
jgi:hypothetical protein